MRLPWPSTRQGSRPILLDGPIGTRLIARGLDLSTESPALWVIDHPETILELHTADVVAGSDAVLTATFGASRGMLERWGRSDCLRALHINAVVLARTAAGPDRRVIGALTLFGPAAVRDGIEQADLLLMAGVDALVLETVRFRDALAFVHEMRPRITVPLVVSLFEPEVPLGFAARALVDAGADVVGANCQAVLIQADLEVEALSAAVPEIPLWLKPGGGLPGGGLQDPRTFAERTQHWIDRGVRFLGGCCGTTPAHLAAMRSVLDQKRDALEPLRR